MRNRIVWLAALVLIGLAVMPQTAIAQHDYVPPVATTNIPSPFGRPHMEQGGFYTAGEFMWWRQTNTMKDQAIGFRGIRDDDGSIATALGIPSFPGQFIGSGTVALDVNQVSGPSTYAPGYGFTFGYRFESGTALEMRWIHLADARYSATASLLPQPGVLSIGQFSENSYITSPVFNFSPNFFGPGNTLGVGSSVATYGIWNASSLQTIDFVQRFDQFELTWRVPMQQSECWRTYGIVGPRLATLWERFNWRVVHPEFDGSVVQVDAAKYSNVTSNRLYGVHLGVGNEWSLGDSQAGQFSLSVDLQTAMFFDFVKGRPKYELGDSSAAASRSRNYSSFVPEVEAQINLWWYPYEGIILRMGYEAMAFFNTYSSPHPVDFNFGSITPSYERTFRLFDGFNFGVGFIF